MLAALTACSSNDDNGNGDNGGSQNTGGNASLVSASKVFTGKKPVAVGDIESVTYDDKGRVTKMKTAEYGEVTLTYGVTRSGEDNVQMTAGNGQFSFNFTIGSNGFAKSCVEHDSEVEGQLDWQFEYDADGRLTNINHVGEDNYKLTYTNGDITTIVEIQDNVDGQTNDTLTISYTSSKVPTPLENKGCLMFYDETFRIDMDEMAIAYYAGLLGKGTAHLPISYKGYDNSEADNEWTLNKDGYPTSLRYLLNGWQTKNFKWQ